MPYVSLKTREQSTSGTEMVAEDEDGRLDQVPPMISIRSRFGSESVLLPSSIFNAANADTLCVFPSRAKYCTLPALKDLDAYRFSQSLPARTPVNTMSTYSTTGGEELSPAEAVDSLQGGCECVEGTGSFNGGGKGEVRSL